MNSPFLIFFLFFFVKRGRWKEGYSKYVSNNFAHIYTHLCLYVIFNRLYLISQRYTQFRVFFNCYICFVGKVGGTKENTEKKKRVFEKAAKSWYLELFFSNLLKLARITTVYLCKKLLSVVLSSFLFFIFLLTFIN